MCDVGLLALGSESTEDVGELENSGSIDGGNVGNVGNVWVDEVTAFELDVDDSLGQLADELLCGDK